MPYKYSIIFGFNTSPADGSNLPSRAAGWTESHWRNAFDITPNAQMNLLQARADLLSTNGSILGVRVTSYLDVNGKFVQQGVSVYPLNLPGANRLLTDIPQMALQINFKATAPDVNVATTDIRALPDARVVGGEYDNNNFYTQAVEGFCNILVNNAWGFVGIDMTKPKVRVISLANSILTVGAGHGVVAGNWIKLYRVRADGGARVTGDYHVSLVAGNALTLDGIADTVAVSVPNGLMRQIVPKFLDYGAFAIARVRTHKVGRNFLPYRGRQRKAS